ncbi:MAG TPA: hypothetical protein VF510_15280 [Ktedonobacterales bacterium]
MPSTALHFTVSARHQVASIGAIAITAEERRIRKRLLAVPVDGYDSSALQFLMAVLLIIVAQIPN